MWSFEFRHETSAKPNAVWALWSEPSSWPRWDEDLEEVVLSGAFDAGTKGSLKPKGMEAVPFELTRVEPGTGYTDVSTLPGASLRFDHDLVRENGALHIVQRVTMTGPAANDYFGQFGSGIVLEVPDALRKLAALAEACGVGSTEPAKGTEAAASAAPERNPCEVPALPAPERG